MELIKQLSEAITRNDKLKAALAKAIDAAVEKYKEHLGDDVVDKIKDSLLDNFDPNITKGEISTKLKEFGVGPSGEVAQTIISLAHKFDAEANRSPVAEATNSEKVKEYLAKQMASLEAVVKKYQKEFADGKADKAREAFAKMQSPNLTIGEIEKVFADLGVANAKKIAQDMVLEATKYKPANKT